MFLTIPTLRTQNLYPITDENGNSTGVYEDPLGISKAIKEERIIANTMLGVILDRNGNEITMYIENNGVKERVVNNEYANTISSILGYSSNTRSSSLIEYWLFPFLSKSSAGNDIGDSVQLTLDAELQKNIANIMAECEYFTDNGGGACVVMNAETGELLSMVSFPLYNANELFDLNEELISLREACDIILNGMRLNVEFYAEYYKDKLISDVAFSKTGTSDSADGTSNMWVTAITEDKKYIATLMAPYEHVYGRMLFPTLNKIIGCLNGYEECGKRYLEKTQFIKFERSAFLCMS